MVGVVYELSSKFEVLQSLKKIITKNQENNGLMKTTCKFQITHKKKKKFNEELVNFRRKKAN